MAWRLMFALHLARNADFLATEDKTPGGPASRYSSPARLDPRRTVVTRLCLLFKSWSCRAMNSFTKPD
jgi:hypothetical protein